MPDTPPAVIIQAQVPTELRDELLVKAAASDRTLSGEVRQAIRAHLGHDA